MHHLNSFWVQEYMGLCSFDAFLRAIPKSALFFCRYGFMNRFFLGAKECFWNLWLISQKYRTLQRLFVLYTQFLAVLLKSPGQNFGNIKKLHLISENLYDTRSKTIFHRQRQTQCSLLYFYDLRQFNTVNVRNSFHTSLKIQLEISTLSFVTFLFLLPKLKTFG